MPLSQWQASAGRDHHWPPVWQALKPLSTQQAQPMTSVALISPGAYDTVLLQIRSTSEKISPHLLVRHFFQPNELEHRNVGGVTNKDPERIGKIREIALVFSFATGSTWNDLLWRDCRNVVNSFTIGHQLGFLCTDFHGCKDLIQAIHDIG